MDTNKILMIQAWYKDLSEMKSTPEETLKTRKVETRYLGQNIPVGNIYNYKVYWFRLGIEDKDLELKG